MSPIDWLTASRVLLTVPVMGLWLSPDPGLRLWGLAIYVAAGLTDFADGRLARRLGRTTRLGAYLDPLADKVLVLGAALALVAGDRLSAWVYLVVLVRELAVMGLRSVLSAGVHMPASLAAKWKTTTQMVAVGASAVLPPAGAAADLTAVLWTLALGLTVWSGWQYFRKFWGSV